MQESLDADRCKEAEAKIAAGTFPYRILLFSYLISTVPLINYYAGIA